MKHLVASLDCFFLILTAYLQLAGTEKIRHDSVPRVLPHRSQNSPIRLTLSAAVPHALPTPAANVAHLQPEP